jgi:hypothetical protein
MKSRSKLPLFFIILLTLISACFGASRLAGAPLNSSALGAQETFKGLRMAYQAQAGTFIMEKGNLILMAWPR